MVRKGQKVTCEGSKVRSWNIVYIHVLNWCLRKLENAMCWYIKVRFSQSGPRASYEPSPRLAKLELCNHSCLVTTNFVPSWMRLNQENALLKVRDEGFFFSFLIYGLYCLCAFQDFSCFYWHELLLLNYTK